MSNQPKKSSIIIFLVVILSIFLNQQKPMYGLNLSFSDFATVILIFSLTLSKKLRIPQSVFMFFMILSVMTLFTAFFLSPHKFNYVVNPKTIITDYIKLISAFIYFLLGYNFSKNKEIGLVCKWYSMGAVMVGLIGIAIVFLNIGFFNKQYFSEGNRYIGLMSDPNYFSVIQCTALSYFFRNKDVSRKNRIVSFAVIFLSVAISGSKTGMLIFMVYTLAILGYSLMSNKNKKDLIRGYIIVLLLIALLPLLLSVFTRIIDFISYAHPVFNRVRMLFFDFEVALSEGGSSRDRTWSAAVDIIQRSPISGVGVGSYLMVRNSIHGGGGFSHNTYLQMMAEWGIPMALIVFSSMFFVVLKHFSLSNQIREESVVARDILIILLLGSLSLSLNNSRMFWLFFGSLFRTHEGKS